MNIQNADTYVVEIFLAGPRKDIERECASYCMAVGLCVSVESTRFIYTGGIEDGCKVRLLQYPRFPKVTDAIDQHAHTLANLLMNAAFQKSALIVGPKYTTWITRKDET